MWYLVDLAGLVVMALVAVAALAVVLALGVALAVYRGRRAPLKRFSAFVLDVLYLPLKLAFAAAKGSRGIAALDAMMVAIKNQANRRRFARAGRRLLLAPQCLRAVDCPAPSTRRGVLCQRCGRCVVADMLGESERLGYRLYVLAGSSFIARIIEEEQPEGALLVACPYECNKVMMALGRLASYAVPLDRDGCMNTEVSLAKVQQAMALGRQPQDGPAPSDG
ncbi:MAG: DUF116 domain-containing protein [Candidatus Brocadiia bacterium]